MTWTHTSRGRALDLLDPKIEDIALDEIALALSNQCRYAGCVTRFYSVAEHSVLICRWLHANEYAPAVQLAGLLHDAAEAYTGDITWPMQAVLWGASASARTAYKDAQARLDRLVCELAGVDPELLHSEAIRACDMRILLDERAALLGMPAPRPWYVEETLGLPPLGVSITGWDPRVARSAFMVELHRTMPAAIPARAS